MKRVIYSVNVHYPSTEDHRQYWALEEKGEATFHQFGVNYEEFESGAGNYSTAIIELDDGTVLNIPAEHIKFINE